jgi:hypothetical protein
MSGNTNNTVFIQRLFSSRDNFVDGNVQEATSNTANFVGQAGRIWWDPTRNNFYASDGNTPGGILIGGASGNGTVFGSNTWVQYNNAGNFGASPNFTFDSSTNVLSATYFSGDGGNLSNVNLTGAAAGNTTEIQFNTDGNFSASGNLRFDTGSNTLYIDQIEIPTGTVLSGLGEVVYVIATLTLNQILANSNGTSTSLPAGSYGNPNEVPAPWAVFQFTTNPSPALEVNDILSGTGIPVPSSVTYVGTGGNSNVVVTTSTFFGLPTPLPTFGTPIPVSRQTLNAGLNITTEANTDIVMTPGEGGSIVWAGNLVPLTNDEFTLGSPTRRIKQAYFGSNTIYINDEYLGVDQSIGANNGNLIVGGGTGLTVGNFILSGNTLYLDNPVEDFNIGTPGATGNLNINRPMTVSDSTGNTVFSVTSDGRVELTVGNQNANTPGALNIVASNGGYYQNVTSSGGMIHVTGNDNTPARVTIDSFGTSGGSGAPVAIIGRVGRGNANTPSAVQANDIMVRVGAVGWATTGFTAPIPTATAMEFVALENFTDTSQGTKITFNTANVGGNSRNVSTTIQANGISFANNTVSNSGITFHDNTFQNTAFNDTSAVTSVTVGVGLTQTATVGDVGIDATGVQGITGTANRIIVTNLGGQNFNISAPQDLNTSSTLTFANLTITGTLTVSNLVSTGNSIIDSKVLNLAANSTSNSQIDQGGIILGNANAAYAVSFLYDLTNDRWDTNGAGLKTLDLYAANANIDFLRVQNGGHFGLINLNLDYPNAYIQVDSNVNSYSQIVSQNHSPGTSASTDLVLVNDIGDDGNHFIDMGINGSNYTDPAFSSTLANDGYLFVNQGNLVIGTDTPAKTIKFVAGGTTSNDIAVTISNTGISTPGNVTANFFIGNGSQLTGIAAGNITGQVANALVAGTVYTNAQPNITSVGTLTTLSVSGNITSGNANLGNVATANFFVGNGYGLTNINVSNVVGTIANANYAAYAGNVVNSLTINNSGSGAASGATFNGGSPVTISYNTVGAPKADGTGASGTWGISITGNSNVANTANAVAGANVSGQVAYAAIANSVAGVNVSGAVAFATTANAVAGANVSGQVGNALVAGTVYTNAQPNITSVGTLTTLTVAGNILGGNISASGMLSTGANIIALGNGAGISQGTWSVAVGYQAGTSNQGNYATAIGPYAGRYNQGDYTTALGQAAGLQSQGTGAIAIGQAGYESQGQYAIAIGSGAGDTMQGNNAIAIGYLAGGDHQTANSIILNASGAALETIGVAGLFINPVRNSLTSNANIVFFNTSTKELTYANTISLAGNANVGNLGTGRVIATGNISGTQLISNIATGTAPFVVTSTTQVANLNVATAGLATFATTANAVAGANVSGTVANATYALNAGNATIASSANSVAGANVSGQVANALVASTVYTNAQPNITSVGTLTGLTSNGVINFANTSNVTLGAVGNLHISGGSANYVLQTNGSNTLSWVAQLGNGAITTITPNALSSSVHIAATVSGNTANIITDATTANTANTIVVRDANGAINVSGWTVGTHLTAVNYTATNSDYWIGTTTKSKTITLPNAANGASNGRQYQIADVVHSGNPNTTIAAQSPATVVGNQPSQQSQIIIATYIDNVWYLN